MSKAAMRGALGVTKWARSRVTGALLFGLVSALARPSFAAPPEDPGAAAPEPPSWRFRDDDRPIKVVVLAGSIGRFQRDPYAERIAAMCSRVEVRNISKTGAGASQLKHHFRTQVLENRRVDLRDPEHEYWLLFGGGLNSIAMPESSNAHVRDLFMTAHARGMKVVGMTVTPWGSSQDKRRWAGANGFHYYSMTRKQVEFILGRASPREALGRQISRRPDPDAPWRPEELADISVDVYDSDLRDREAPLRDLESMRQALAADPKWRRAHADLDEPAREARLAADAEIAVEIPRWHMKEEYRSFDHTHPNTEGHAVIAATLCPSLPENWGCTCPSPSTPAEASDSGGDP